MSLLVTEGCTCVQPTAQGGKDRPAMAQSKLMGFGKDTSAQRDQEVWSPAADEEARM